ncbi:CapA family protein [Bradyrhizobium sp. 150]|uniref:CapA family protein n=1 Tax=Bradyrhizobium sp. 150 TaxID=2782625 RepID=UPI001FFBC6F8|nr:CapA family protein [Bradyrhizobium sp. 150]MCK1676474.1 CapA family protein [Bradyrhizobium sp. 150]
MEQLWKSGGNRSVLPVLCTLLVAGLAVQVGVADTLVPQNTTEAVQQGARYDDVASTATNVADGFTMVAVGDLIVSSPLTKDQESGFGLVVKILRDADVTFGNLETNVFDLQASKGSPQAEAGGLISVPEVGPDLKTMGFNVVSRANNHALDWGLEAMRETSRVLNQNGIVHAGVGENLAQAGAARFLETARGRVALVSFASTFTPLSRAADPAGEAPGRPGLNALRLAKSIVVPSEMIESLRRIRNALPDAAVGRDDPDRVVLAGATYKIGEKVGYSYEADSRDGANILRNVRQGKQFSDFCIVTNHGHEPGNWSQEPPDYAQSFAHKLIDAGADAYVVHGSHLLRGIEIYKGRPIFYGVGNFIFDNLQTTEGADMFGAYGKDPRVDTVAELTATTMVRGSGTNPGFSDAVFYESVVTVSRFEQNQLVELRLYPIELGYSKRFADRGVPRLASARQAIGILERLKKLSEPFGTQITVENGIGVVKFRPGTSSTPP